MGEVSINDIIFIRSIFLVEGEGQIGARVLGGAILVLGRNLVLFVEVGGGVGVGLGLVARLLFEALDLDGVGGGAEGTQVTRVARFDGFVLDFGQRWLLFILHVELVVEVTPEHPLVV
jgi:hypothetical protein